MENKLYVELPPFTGRNVPIKEIAQAIGRDRHYIRLGIRQGILNSGVAIRPGKLQMSSATTARNGKSGKKQGISVM